MLNDEERDDLISRMNGSEPEEGNETEVQDAATEESPSGEEQEANTSEAKEDVSSGSSPESDEVEDGHSVPYSRFKKVIGARNKFRSELDAMQQKYAELEASLKGSAEVQTAADSVKDVKSDSDWLDNLLSNEKPEPEDDRYSQLDSRIARFEVQQEQQKLEMELQTVSETYPNVPRDLLLQSVIQNPNVVLEDVAERYSNYIAQIEEQAIARYSKENKPAAPPRPKGTSSRNTSSPSASDVDPSKMTRDERRAALRAALSNN